MTKRGAGFLAEWAPRFALSTTIQVKDGRMGKRYTQADPTASEAIGNADKEARGIPADRALNLAAAAKRRGDLAGYELFMAAARKARA